MPPPSVLDPTPLVEPFLAEAQRRGVTRVVLLTSALGFPNAPGLLEMADRVRAQPGGVVLRASGFMANLLRPHPLAQSIREHGEIPSSAGAGRVGWIDVHDIDAAASAPLDGSPGGAGDDYVLAGPRALRYPDAAEVMTPRTGRTLRIREIDVEEVAARIRAAGLPAELAESLAAVESDIAAGRYDHVTTSVLDLTGHPPRTFAEFVGRHADEWTAREAR